MVVAVEEVLGVVDDLSAAAAEEFQGVADHFQIFLERCSQDLADVQVPAFSDNGQYGGTGAFQGGEGDIVGSADVRLAGHAEGGNSGVAEFELADLTEEGAILGVAERVSSLDVVNTDIVEVLGDGKLVLEAEGDAEGLGPVAKSGIVDGDTAGFCFSGGHGLFTACESGSHSSRPEL